MSDLVFRSTATGGDSTLGVSSVSASVPSGTASGDGQTLWVTCGVAAPATPPGINTPSGWTLRGSSGVLTIVSGVINIQMHLYERIAGGSESSATISTVGSVNAALGWVRTARRNPDGTQLVGQVVWSTSTGGPGTTATVSAITTARNNSTCEVLISQGVAQGVSSSSTGMTERAENTAQGVCTYDQHQPIKGSTGSESFTLPSSADYVWGHAELYSDSGDQMAVIGAGAQSVSTTSGGTLSPAYPAGYTAVADDICVLVAAGKHNNGSSLNPSNPSGWGAPLGSRFREVGTYDLQVIAWAKRLTASEAAPSLTVPAAYSTTSGGLSAQLLIVRGVDTTTLEDATAVASDGDAAATFTPTGITPVTNEAMVISCVATADDNALALSSGSEQGFALQMGGANYDTTTGGDHAVGVAHKIVHTAAATTCPTWSETAVGNDAWAAITIALRPPAPPAKSLMPVQSLFARVPALRRA